MEVNELISPPTHTSKNASPPSGRAPRTSIRQYVLDWHWHELVATMHVRYCLCRLSVFIWRLISIGKHSRSSLVTAASYLPAWARHIKAHVAKMHGTRGNHFSTSSFCSTSTPATARSEPQVVQLNMLSLGRCLGLHSNTQHFAYDARLRHWPDAVIGSHKEWC